MRLPEHPAWRLLRALLTVGAALVASAEERNLRRAGQQALGRDGGGPSSLLAKSGAAQAPGTSPIGLCVKDTNRQCRAWHEGNVVDHVTQCAGGPGNALLGATHVNVSGQRATCSADQPGSASTVGTCRCAAEYCADKDGHCHQGSYLLVNAVFTITTKIYGLEEKLYMTPDGRVMVGYPPDPRAAQWRIAVTRGGVKILWTELYTNTILQEYESCLSLTDEFGLPYTQCRRIVGHVPDPNAGEMGWYIEMYGDGTHRELQKFDGVHVQLRAADTWNMFLISHQTKEGRACEARGRNCPGDAGAFRFDPPLVERMDIVLDNHPGTLPGGLGVYAVTCVMTLILMTCLACVYVQQPEQGSTYKFMKGMASCVLIPCVQIARCVGFKNQGAKIG